jgi:hypothetical protein
VVRSAAGYIPALKASSGHDPSNRIDDRGYVVVFVGIDRAEVGPSVADLLLHASAGNPEVA